VIRNLDSFHARPISDLAFSDRSHKRATSVNGSRPQSGWWTTDDSLQATTRKAGSNSIGESAPGLICANERERIGLVHEALDRLDGLAGIMICVISETQLKKSAVHSSEPKTVSSRLAMLDRLRDCAQAVSREHCPYPSNHEKLCPWNLSVPIEKLLRASAAKRRKAAARPWKCRVSTNGCRQKWTEDRDQDTVTRGWGAKLPHWWPRIAGRCTLCGARDSWLAISAIENRQSNALSCSNEPAVHPFSREQPSAKAKSPRSCGGSGLETSQAGPTDRGNKNLEHTSDRFSATTPSELA